MQNVNFSKIKEMVNRFKEEKMSSFVTENKGTDHAIMAAELGNELVMWLINTFHRSGMRSQDVNKTVFMTLGSIFGAVLANFFSTKE